MDKKVDLKSRRASAGTTFAVATVLSILIIAAIGFSMRNPLADTTSASSISAPSSASDLTTTPSSLVSSFTGNKPVSVSWESCGIASESGTSCSTSVYEAGTPQPFTLSGGSNATTFTEYFAVSADEDNIIGYSMKATNSTTFQGYFIAGANTTTESFSPASLAASGDEQNQIANQTGNYQAFSGSITTQEAGAYVFVFTVPAPEFNDSASFLLLDSAAYDSGITVTAGAPNTQEVTISESFSDGGVGQEGFGWNEVPITVYAPAMTSVNLTSLTLDNGAWLKIVPSYLPDVGPQGANAALYMNGVGPTTNQYNDYLFIGASGADGLTGGTVFPVELSSGLNVVRGPGPVSLSGGGIPYIVGLVYDPSSATSAPLTISVSVAGLLEQNGSVVSLPSWLNVSYPEQHIVFGNGSTTVSYTTLSNGNVLGGVPQYESDDFTTNSSSSSFNLVLQPNNPYYFVLTVDGYSAPKADQGIYTVVLDETVSGQHFVSDLAVYAYQIPVGIPG